MRGEAVKTEKGEAVKTERAGGGRRGQKMRERASEMRERASEMRERVPEQKVFGKKARFFLWLSFCLAMACILE